MAEIIGRAGRTAGEESYRRFRWEGLLVIILMFAAGVILGLMIPKKLLQVPPPIYISGLLLFLAAAWFFANRADQTFKAYDKERRNWIKGADGEAVVSEILRSLPDDFVVVNDISKRFGNIDHVVIGPTGIYVINTKNWRGMVTPGEDSELLLNEKSTSNPEVRNLSHAVMGFHEKVKSLCDKDYFVRGLLVFVGTCVNVDFSATKHIHCLREDHVVDYIHNKEFAGRLSPEDIKRIKRAVCGLAHMDEQFVES